MVAHHIIAPPSTDTSTVPRQTSSTSTSTSRPPSLSIPKTPGRRHPSCHLHSLLHCDAREASRQTRKTAHEIGQQAHHIREDASDYNPKKVVKVLGTAVVGSTARAGRRKSVDRKVEAREMRTEVLASLIVRNEQ